MNAARKPGLRSAAVVLLVPLIFLTLLGIAAVRDHFRRAEASHVFTLVVALKNGTYQPTSRADHAFWTADVAGLNRLGWSPREVAEADAAPKEPIATVPVPYHGYFVLAMDSLSDHNGQTQDLKARDWNSDFAYCVFPADPERSDLPTYLVCPWGIFRRNYIGKVTRWPEPFRTFRAEWAIVD